MMTTISDDSFSDDAHNVRKRSEINFDCMYGLFFILFKKITNGDDKTHFVLYGLTNGRMMKILCCSVQR